MTQRGSATSSRKRDHLAICCEMDVEQGQSGFSDVRLVHDALPECELENIVLETRFMDRELTAPLLIAAMTGGHPETREINRRLAIAAERFGLAMGVGSQRAALENPALAESFTVVRETAPTAFLVANLGIVQLREHGIAWAEKAVEMIDAQAIAIHTNFLQEAIQPEGDHDARGCLQALVELCRDFRYPVIVKETGSGISRETARKILGAGADAIDIGGLGGTSWALVESYRYPEDQRRILHREFYSWGIPTVVSLHEVVSTGAVTIATGGVRSGIDIAKGIALGAHLCGMALPLLRAASAGEETLEASIAASLQQLRTAMFLTGSQNLADLRGT
ncbi:MAG: type 2 isopentenyl-diphosphate Delta-isomerase, partial [Methanomicrobiales archaeon]|nr:type 2 isopentenyl-diphosphate Delta-isomerase [Methanomicrobiales archaeon]